MNKRVLIALASIFLLVVSCSTFQNVIHISTPTASIIPAVPNSPTDTFTPASPTPTSEPPVNRTSAGYIENYEIWRGEHHVTGDVWVRSGATLIIEPGTTVTIAANSDEHNLLSDELDLRIGINTGERIDGVHNGEPFRDEQHHISLWIEGTLNAVGTQERPITITSDSPRPTRYDWNRIQIWNGQISYATIEYYRIIHTITANVEISNSTLRYIGECGICAYSNARIIGNRIFDAGHELIDVKGDPVIRDNIIGPNPEHACIHVVEGNPIIENNQIHESCP